jgi:hypothetical protein
MPKTPSSKPKTPKPRPKSQSPSAFKQLLSLAGFAVAAPKTQQAKQRDKSPVKNGQQKVRIRTSGSVKRR